MHFAFLLVLTDNGCRIASVLYCYHGDDLSPHESSKQCKMTQEEEKTKATIKNVEEENQNTCGNAELLQAAEERSEEMLVNFSDSLKLNSADVDEQPEGGVCHELPMQIYLTLVVQR